MRISPQHRLNRLNLLAYVDRSGSDCKPAVSVVSTLFKTTYSNTSKMAEKRQRGLAEMWQLAAPKTKRKKDVPGNHIM